MKKSKNNLDEMQNLKLLQIEHTGCWIAVWGLLASIYIQMAFGLNEFKHIGGEAIVLMVVSVYLVVSCIKNGIWDRRLKPDFKTNLTISLTAGGLFGLYWFIVSYRNYHKLLGSAATFVLMAAAVSALILFVLCLCSGAYKKQAKKLEDEAEQEDEE